MDGLWMDGWDDVTNILFCFDMTLPSVIFIYTRTYIYIVYLAT